MPFRVFEHTADIGLDVEAESLDALFADAARGLFAVVRGDNEVAAVSTFEVEARAASLDRLLVSFLEEFIFLQDAEGVVFRDVEDVRIAGRVGGWVATARVVGEPFSHERHPGCLHVKAATRHTTRVVDVGPGRPARARVILDV